MSVTAEQLIATARSYLGTPYGNQGRTRRMLDCGGLLLVVGRDLGLTQLEHLGYANSPNGEEFERLLEENCIRVEPKEAVRVADIIAVDYGDGIQHTAIVTRLDPFTVIHAKRPRGAAQRQKGRGVIEHRLLPNTEDLKGWVRTYRIPGVDS